MACGAAGSPDERRRRPFPSADAAAEWFADEARAAGLDFVHFNGMSGKYYQPEIMAPGVAMFDYDNDGDLDVYLSRAECSDRAAAAAAPSRSKIASIGTISS